MAETPRLTRLTDHGFRSSPTRARKNPRVAILVSQGDSDRPTIGAERKGNNREWKERKDIFGVAETP